MPGNEAGTYPVAARKERKKTTMSTSTIESPLLEAELVAPLNDRRSPRAFDPHAELPAEDLVLMLQAARWAPSAANTQPWRFVIGQRGSQEFNTILGALSRGNASWAHNASALVLAITTRESEDGNLMRWSEYDLGQAAAHLSVQAHAMGYIVHQMGGFDAEALRRDFQLEDTMEPLSVIAIGTLGRVEDLPERYQAAESNPRLRKPLSDLVLCGLE
jgi:nitroreductase